MSNNSRVNTIKTIKQITEQFLQSMEYQAAKCVAEANDLEQKAKTSELTLDEQMRLTQLTVEGVRQTGGYTAAAALAEQLITKLSK